MPANTVTDFRSKNPLGRKNPDNYLRGLVQYLPKSRRSHSPCVRRLGNTAKRGIGWGFGKLSNRIDNRELAKQECGQAMKNRTCFED